MLIKILVFKNLAGNLNKMTIAKMGRQHQKSLDSYFKSSSEYLYLFGVINYYFIPMASILLELIVYILGLILLMFSYPSIIQLYAICHINEKTTP